MLTGVYRRTLRLPRFRGRDRLAAAMRSMMRPAVSTVYSGLRMQLDPIEWIQIEILRDGIHDASTIRLYEQILGYGDTYVDVGAHVGFHTLVARSLVGPTGHLIAVDPQPYNCDRILLNAGLNGFVNISIVVAAVGPMDGLVELNNQLPHDKAKLSLSRHWSHENTQQQFTVAMCKLDTLTELLHSISLLKVDVEAYEIEVWKGATATLAKTKNLIVELHPESGSIGCSANYLKEMGFRLFDVHGQAWEPGKPCDGDNVWATRE
jgi:FkbM family methyltransferase